MRSTPGGFGGWSLRWQDLTRPAGPFWLIFQLIFHWFFLCVFVYIFDGFREDSGAILEPFWRSKSIKNALKNVLIFWSTFLLIVEGFLEVLWEGGFSDKKSIKSHRKIERRLIDFLIDFKRYFTASPKVATLDPFENFRVNHGVRPLQQSLKKC